MHTLYVLTVSTIAIIPMAVAAFMVINWPKPQQRRAYWEY
jgi:hypothetical protein